MSWDVWHSRSLYSPHARLLNNRLARDVLEGVYQLIPAGTRGGPALDDPRHTSPAVHEYQNWLHQRLRDSGLAKALAAGPDFLPDITAELPPLWRFIARLTAPRNYRRLAEQVVRNLGWYLGEGVPPRTLTHQLRDSLLPSVLLTLMLLLSLMTATSIGGQPWPVLLLAGLILLIIVFASVFGMGHDNNGRFKANCAELYAYLLQAYAEPDPDSENLVRSVLEEMGRDTDNSNEELTRRARKRGGGMTLR